MPERPRVEIGLGTGVEYAPAEVRFEIGNQLGRMAVDRCAVAQAAIFFGMKSGRKVEPGIVKAQQVRFASFGEVEAAAGVGGFARTEILDRLFFEVAVYTFVHPRVIAFLRTNHALEPVVPHFVDDHIAVERLHIGDHRIFHAAAAFQRRFYNRAVFVGIVTVAFGVMHQCLTDIIEAFFGRAFARQHPAFHLAAGEQLQRFAAGFEMAVAEPGKIMHLVLHKMPGEMRSFRLPVFTFGQGFHPLAHAAVLQYARCCHYIG